MSIEYNEEQKNVIKTFIRFLRDPTEKYMIIQGNAGSGKTTMIKGLVNAVAKQYKLLKLVLCEDPEKNDFDLVLTATTNKAVAVLRELSGNPEVATIHSTLKLSLQKNFSTGREALVKTLSWKPLYDTVLIVDEASMLDESACKHLDDTLKGKSKAIFVGDVFQLAPVKSTESMMQGMLHKVPTAIMGKVMRHRGAILETASAFRDVVKTSYFEDIVLSEDVIHVDGINFKKEVDKTFLDKSYAPHKAKILAWSNNRVQEYNNYLRKAKGLNERFSVGETVITNNPIIGKKQTIPVDSEVVIIELEKEISLHGVLGRYAHMNNSIRGFLPNKYVDAKNLLKLIAKKAKSKELKDSPEKRKKLWRTYFEIKETWLDLRSSFASTVHKAQGSTYNKVFIDLYDIGRCNRPSDVARMLYVSLSRARDKVILTGELPAKYRSSAAA